MRLRIWLAAGICLAIIALLVGSVLVGSKTPTAREDKASDFVLKDVEGKTHKLSDFKGKVVVLNWFSTW